ncbi:MAG: polysaccharide deacetylase family protein [Aquabacterium sp.]
MATQAFMKLSWSALSVMSGNRLRVRGARAGRDLYITFDDGPDPVHTPALLDLLSRHGAKATFFLIGASAERHPAVVDRIVGEGHAIGNHSMTHPRMPRLNARQQVQQITQANEVLRRWGDPTRMFFRPPNGRLTVPLVLQALTGGQPIMLWSVDSLDYRDAAPAVVDRLTALTPVPGDVMLFHDDGACAARALAIMLPRWRRDGFDLRRLD